MNDFQGLLSSDYGFKPQGKAAPMAPAKSTSNSSPFNFEIGGSKTSSYPSSIPKNSSSVIDDHETLFRPNRKTPIDDLGNLDDVFSVGGSKLNSSKSTNSNNSSVNLDSIFGGGAGIGGGDSGMKFSSLPVFDKPVYDDDVSSSANYEDIFSSSSSSYAKKDDAFDDLLGGLGKKEQKSAKSGSKVTDKGGIPSFDDLLPGFGGGSTSSINRNSSDANKKTSSEIDDPFVVLESTSPPMSYSSGIFTDPLEEIGKLNNSGKKTVENPSSGGVFDDIDPLGSFAKSVPVFSAETNGEEKEASSLGAGAKVSGRQTSVSGDASQKSSVRSPERGFEKKVSMEDYSDPSVFEMSSVSAETTRPVPTASSPAHSNASFRESSSHGHASPSSEENMGSSDDIWLTVSEVPLFTHPTAAPPPSRPPPPRPARFSRGESGSFPASNAYNKANDSSSFPGTVPNFQSPKSAPAGARGSFASPIDELEEFAMGRNQVDVDGISDVQSGEDIDSNSAAAASAAAMKEAMDRAEAKFRHARGVRERENAKASRGRESAQVEKEEKPMYDTSEREFREHQEQLEHERRQREEEERRRREEEERRRIEKEWEEKEREKRKVEKERELARQAVERAAKEARERAAVEARARAERVAVQKAQAEARERAGRVAVQRANAEARERAAAGAKERAEKAATEAKEKAKAEAREKEARERETREKEAREREAREKEARERGAREKAASAARANQQKNENDLESFFSMGSRASSAPRPRATVSDPFEAQFQSKPAPEATRTSANSSSSMRKASSSTNIVDDLSSIFGGPPPSSGDFQDIDGETEDRRKARMERHHRTQERAAKALAEKNARDLEVQREQAERYRIGESLDVEIRRWAAGKEGNLRALLSTLQYVLWPECGWQPVSLTDLITGAAVKKVYRKATLCIHPDKVQQKGATLQQKYVAEKVFDLLKEAWNKFNSEELF